MRRFVTLLALFVSISLEADKLILKSGQTLEGTVQEEPGSANVIVLTDTGSRLIVPRNEIREGNVTFQGPRACLREKSGKETCNHLVARISESEITLVDDTTGKSLVQPWNNYVSASFKNLAPTQVSKEILPKGMQIEVTDKAAATSRGIVTTSSASSMTLEKQGQRAEIRLESIKNLTVKNPLGEPSGLFWPGYGIFVPGLKQMGSKETRTRGIALLGSSAFFAGLAFWSQAEATRARNSASTALPLAGTLALFSSGNAKRFNRAKAINYIAILGLGSAYFANTVDLYRTHRPSLSASAQSVELSWSIPF